MLNEIVSEGEKMSLYINEEKTKIQDMIKKNKDKYYTFEEVDKFKYLGWMTKSNM